MNPRNTEKALIDIVTAHSSDQEKAKQLSAVLEKIASANKSEQDAFTELKLMGIPIQPPKLLSVDYRNDEFRTALSIAAEKGNNLCMRLLIDAGADHNACGLGGMTPLMYAAAHGHEKCVVLLAEQQNNDMERVSDYGAPDFYGPKLNALMMAAKNRKVDSVKALLDAKANINSKRRDYPPYTALMMAAQSDYTDVVAVLCEAGAKIDLTDEFDVLSTAKPRTALDISIQNDSLSCAYVLLIYGAIPKDPCKLFKLMGSEKYCQTSLAFNCASLLKKHFEESLKSKSLNDSDIVLLSRVSDFIQNLSTQYSSPIAYKKTAEYLFKLKCLSTLPKEIINIIASYDDTPGQLLSNQMDKKTFTAEIKSTFFAKKALTKKKDGPVMAELPPSKINKVKPK
jgi:ankyrin repeat protein